LKKSELRFDIDPSLFPKIVKPVEIKQEENNPVTRPGKPPVLSISDEEDYGDPGIFDDLEFDHIDNFTRQRTNSRTLGNPQRTNSRVLGNTQRTSSMVKSTQDYMGLEIDDALSEDGNSKLIDEPVQLPNGKWSCRHKCADKTKFV
jgi:hypothetical protein